MQKRHFETRIYPFVVVFCCLAVAVAGYFVYAVFTENSKREYQSLQAMGRKLGTAFDHELQVQKVTLEILGAEAQSVLAGDITPQRGTTADLVPSDDPLGFTLKIPEGMKANQVGNLTGLGEIPPTGSSLAGEMDMALSLSPLFEQVIKNNTSLPWVYYTSARSFEYMYPRVAPQDFFFEESLHNKEFFTIATPENDPSRSLVWSPLYNDLAGAGMMVTISKPIYEGDTFRGVLSIDIGISELLWLPESNAPTHATAYLVGPQGERIAGLGTQQPLVNAAKLKPEELTQVDGRSYMVFPLKAVNWFVVFDVDYGAIQLRALNNSAYVGLIFLFVIFSVLLILVITHYMRSVHYMAVHDNLTGVLNRRAFDDWSLASLKRTAPENDFFGLAVVDIDYFKNYNDTYGHLAGDEALRRVANALRNGLRSPMDEIFRVGGEEFAIVLFIKSTEDFAKILERLVLEVGQLGIPHRQSPIGFVTISAGGVVADLEKIFSLEEVYNRADYVLYQAKSSGRNCWKIV